MLKLLGIIPDLLNLAKTTIGGFFDLKKNAQVMDLEKYKVDGHINETWLLADVQMWQNAPKEDRFMRYVFVYPLGFWWTCIILDSCFNQFFGSWKVLSAPVLENWGGWILAFLFLHYSSKK